jgi:c-di-GMP-binding flagellar brake protein YcgR
VKGFGAKMQQERVERRKYKRFQVPVGAFIVLGPDSTKLGRITDIGLGGIGFSHVERKEPLEGLRQFDMFHLDNGFNLKKIPFQTIWDSEFKKGLFGLMTTRRTGLEFGELTYSQRSQLEHFILNYTTAVCLDHPDLRTRPPQAQGLAPIGL